MSGPFIEGFCRKGDKPSYINMSKVEQMVPRIVDGRINGYRCLNSKGKEIGIVSDPPNARLVIPDTGNAKLLEFWLDEDELPGTDLRVREIAVIGWDLSERWPEPITNEDEHTGDRGGIYCIASNGRWNFGLWEPKFGTYEEAVAYARQQLCLIIEPEVST